MYSALFIAVLGLSVTALARDGPKADDFARRFPKGPVDTRDSLMDLFERIAAWNGGLHVVAATGFFPVLSGAGR